MLYIFVRQQATVSRLLMTKLATPMCLCVNFQDSKSCFPRRNLKKPKRVEYISFLSQLDFHDSRIFAHGLPVPPSPEKRRAKPNWEQPRLASDPAGRLGRSFSFFTPTFAFLNRRSSQAKPSSAILVYFQHHRNSSFRTIHSHHVRRQNPAQGFLCHCP